MQVGDVVTIKGKKTRATVVQVLDGHKDWSGWVEISPALGGFTRWHTEELQLASSSRGASKISLRQLSLLKKTPFLCNVKNDMVLSQWLTDRTENGSPAIRERKNYGP